MALALILLLTIILHYKSKKSEKKHKIIAQELLHSVLEKNGKQNNVTHPQDTSSTRIQNENVEEKIIRITSEEVAQNILRELNIFEAKEHFLQKGITLNYLAKKIKTNPRYLSEVVNIYKGKNFATYLNDLRIDYAIKRLAKDKKFRSYKLLAIAEELGYNNEQAFALAFKKKTETPLTTYIKEIDKLESQNSNKNLNFTEIQ